LFDMSDMNKCESYGYEAPRVYTLGTVEELTRDNTPDKCGGSGDAFLPQQLSNTFSVNCP
jgi:hypothetical protein